MKKRYIPGTNALALAWMLNFSTQITATPTAYGLTAGDATAIDGYVDAFAAAQAIAEAPETRTPVAIQARNTARANAETVCRPYAMQIQANPTVTPAQLIELGLTVREAPTPVPAPLTFPLLSFLGATPGVHKLEYRDSATPTSKAKPSNVVGMEIYRAVGPTAAISPAQCAYVGTYTKTPLTQSFTAGDAGDVATYFARWITRSGPAGVAQVGPWSSAVSAQIIA